MSPKRRMSHPRVLENRISSEAHSYTIRQKKRSKVRKALPEIFRKIKLGVEMIGI